MHWRTSMAASAAWLICAAISIARASSLTSTTQKPASEFLDARSGPSVAAGTPSRTLDGLGLGWVGEALLEHELAGRCELDVDPSHEVDHAFDPLGRPFPPARTDLRTS